VLVAERSGRHPTATPGEAGQPMAGSARKLMVIAITADRDHST
jgi:hypothetical protein